MQVDPWESAQVGLPIRPTSDCQSDVPRTSTRTYQVMMADRRKFDRRHLPHWQPDGATLFITFRIADPLPRAVTAALQEKREQEEPALSRVRNVQERQAKAYPDARMN